MDADRARFEKHADQTEEGDLPTQEYYTELIAITRNACDIVRWCCKDYEDDTAFATQSNAGLLDDLVFLHESLHTPGVYGVFDEIIPVLSAQIAHLRTALQDILPTLTALEGQLTQMILPQE